MKTKLNLEYLEAFIISAETGKFNLTAEISFKSHSAISIQIKKLEQQLGTTLFIRDRDSLKLTKNGEILYHQAKKMLKLADDIFYMLNDVKVNRKITIGIPTDYSMFFVKNILPKLKERYDEISFEVLSNRSRTIRRSLNEGKIDIGIVALETEEDNSIILWQENINWVCSKNFVYNKSEKLPVALFSDDCLINTYSLYYLRKSNIKFDVIFTSTLLNDIAEVVASGEAVSLLPQSNITSSLKKMDSQILECHEKLKMGLIFNQNMSQGLVNDISSIIRSLYLEYNNDCYQLVL